MYMSYVKYIILILGIYFLIYGLVAQLYAHKLLVNYTFIDFIKLKIWRFIRAESQ
jgi:hypothetical protein